VPQDNVEAYKWHNLAAAQGNETAKENKGIIAKKMTSEQIAEAQKRSADFKLRGESAP
jgi:TPR repeat protein